MKLGDLFKESLLNFVNDSDVLANAKEIMSWYESEEIHYGCCGDSDRTSPVVYIGYESASGGNRSYKYEGRFSDLVGELVFS